MRVLVVDDDAVVRSALEGLLGCLGWQVDAAVDVASALRLVARTGHDAAVLDHDLPDGTGAQVAAALVLLRPGTHVVMHTGAALPAPPPGVAVLVPKRAGLIAVLDALEPAGPAHPRSESAPA